MKINLWPLALIFIVDELPPDTGGCANGPVVRILKKYENDEGLKMHELEHVSQFWRMALSIGIPLFVIGQILGFIINLAVIIGVALAAHSLLYSRVGIYRYWTELKAYVAQTKYATNKEAAISKFGSFIAKHYDLNVTKEEATTKLKSLI